MHHSTQGRLDSALHGIPRRGTEASFKLAPGELSAARGLIGIEKRLLSFESLSRIVGQLHAPGEVQSVLREEHVRANFFYFGYEDGATSALKLYFEYPVMISPLTPSEAQGPDASRPSLQMRGYKWDARTAALVAVTEYVWYVHLTPEGVVQRIQAIGVTTTTPGIEVVKRIVERWKTGSTSPVYIEAREPGSPRVSYDVNVYTQSMAVDAIATDIGALAKTYGISAESLARVLADTRGRQLGHLSGGIGRDGRDFLTIYYET